MQQRSWGGELTNVVIIAVGAMNPNSALGEEPWMIEVTTFPWPHVSGDGFRIEGRVRLCPATIRTPWPVPV